MPKRGQEHHFAKLSDEQVAEMRKMREENPKLWSYDKLAMAFGCGHSTVRDILTFRTRYGIRH